MVGCRNAGLGISQALRGSAVALLGALVAGLILPATASAMPMTTDEYDLTHCFDRTTAEASQIMDDAVEGNFWARRDTYTLDTTNVGCPMEDGGEGPDFFGGGFIDGISVIAKTPFQIDSTPDIDDIDSAGDFSILAGEMASLWPDFDHWGGNAEAGDAEPTIGPEGMFISVRGCAGAVGAMTIAQCLADSPVTLINIGGGFMIFSLDLFEEEDFDNSFCVDGGLELCDGGITEFEIVSIFHSNVFDPPDMGDIDLPELVFGVRLVHLTPEPSVFALLAPVLAAGALRRRGRA